MSAQPQSQIIKSIPLVDFIAIVLKISGAILVLSSFYQLGLRGTYLGDYFGYLMKKRVTGFPFSILNNPMYVGSTLIFVGMAMRYAN